MSVFEWSLMMARLVMFEFMWFIVVIMVVGIIASSIKLQRDNNKYLTDARKRFDESAKNMEGLDPEYVKMIDDGFWELQDD